MSKHRSHDGWIEDAGTLERLGVANVHIVRRVRSPFGNRFLSMSQDGFDALADLTPALSKTAVRIMFKLLGRLDYNNALAISQTELGRLLGVKPPNVSAAFKELVRAGVLVEHGRLGSFRTYRLNPEFGWKGNSVDHHATLRDYQRNK